MAGPSTRGGKRGKKKIYLKPSRTGAQFYQSDASRKSIREAQGDDALGDSIDRALTKKMLAREISPKRSGYMKADTFIDRVHDTNFEDETHEKVRGMKKGGAVRGYSEGGSVCRGGGAAVGGTKFRGVR